MLMTTFGFLQNLVTSQSSNVVEALSLRLVTSWEAHCSPKLLEHLVPHQWLLALSSLMKMEFLMWEHFLDSFYLQITWSYLLMLLPTWHRNQSCSYLGVISFLQCIIYAMCCAHIPDLGPETLVLKLNS